MKSTTELLEEAVQNLPGKGLKPTYYRLGIETGISDQLMYKYRHKEIALSDESALKISPFLNYPPEIILLWARMEREKNPDLLQVWQRMEARLSA